MILKRAIILATSIVLLSSATSAQRPAQPEFKVTPLRGSVAMLHDDIGGNVAACSGDDGILLVDSGFAQVTSALIIATEELSNRPIRWLINTHWHFDHVGGNATLAEEGATIIAHRLVRERMRRPRILGGMERQVPASEPAALPDVTFERGMQLHLNDEHIRVIHVGPAHTNGDSFVYFEKANVLHVGDVYFNRMYPYIDVNAGGNLDGFVSALDRALAIANDDTRIIPGHGPLSNIAELKRYRDTLSLLNQRIDKLVDSGKSREEVIAAKPTAEYDAEWAKAFPPDLWVGLVYDGITRAETIPPASDSALTPKHARPGDPAAKNADNHE